MTLVNRRMTPTVTWLLPVRNGMPYLTETLHAIARQRPDGPSHALYAWDNGSDDGTLDELRRWIPARLPGRVFAGTRLSVGAALARLVEAAPSEYCARIDADDLPEADRLVRQVSYFDRHPDVAIVGSDVTPIDDRGLVLPDKRTSYHGRHSDMVHELLYRCPVRHPAVTFRRSAVLAVGNYADMQPTEDYDLLLRLAARYRMANLPQRLLRYRHHRRSVSYRINDFPNYHREVRSRIFARHATALFGLDETEAARLSRGELACALPALARVVMHLEQHDPVGFWSRFRSDSFQTSVLRIIGRRDRWTHWFLRLSRCTLRRPHPRPLSPALHAVALWATQLGLC